MVEKRLVRAEDLVNELEISKPLAYKLIAQMNKELKEKGYMIISGKVPRAYYKQRFFFGYDIDDKNLKVG